MRAASCEERLHPSNQRFMTLRKNRAFHSDRTKRSERGYGHDRDGNRSGYGQSGLQPEIGVCSAKNNPKYNARHRRFEREFQWGFVSRDVWLKHLPRPRNGFNSISCPAKWD